jgi:hypothetical protein
MLTKEEFYAKPLKEHLLSANLGLSESDFSYYASDLYVLAKPGVYEWLKENHPYFSNVTRFVGADESEWHGKQCLEIPFAHVVERKSYRG